MTDSRTLKNQSRRYPWAPVEAYLSRHWVIGGAQRNNPDSWRAFEPMPTRRACDLLGIPETTYESMRKGGVIDDRQADKIATNLGLHPCLLWPDWFAKA